MKIENEKKEEKKLSKREFVWVLVMILILSGFTFWHFKRWRKSLKEVKPPKIEMPKAELFPKKEGYKEWASPDGKLKMKYRADWIEMKEDIFKNLTTKEEGETLFFAQKFDFKKAAQGFLTVQKLNLEKKKDIEEIIEKMKNEVKEKEGKMEILDLKVEDKTATFEAKYEGKTGLPLHSKEKIILTNENFYYLITFSTFERNWETFKEEANEIIDSIQYLE